MARYLLAAALAAAAVGCGPGGPRRAAVSGTVAVGGKPVENGRVLFIPESGPEGGGDVVAGRYDVPAAEGPGVGTCRVELHAYRATGRKLPGAVPGTTVDEMEEVLPQAYHARSTLTREVRPGRNAIDFDLPARP